MGTSGPRESKNALEGAFVLGRLVIRLERRVLSTARSKAWGRPGGLTFGCFLPIIGLR